MELKKIDGKITYSDGTEKVIPYGRTKIKVKEYSHNKNIVDVVLPNSITSIEDWAFFACINLANIVLPKSLETIGTWAFSGCRHLKNLSIEAEIKSIGKYAFANCHNLTVNFYGTISRWEELYSDDVVVKFGDDGKIIYLDGSELSIPYGTEKIVASQYAYNEEIYGVVLPESVLSIEEKAFYLCENLTEVVLPKYLKHIGENAFAKCHNLKSIFIPSSVEDISKGAFSYCENLGSVLVQTGNSRYYSENNCLIDREENKIILGCYNSGIPLGIASIGADAFSGQSLLTNISIPYGIQSIGEGAFKDCTMLKEISVSNNVKYIGEDAFINCDNIKIYFIGTKEMWGQICHDEVNVICRQYGETIDNEGKIHKVLYNLSGIDNEMHYNSQDIVKVILPDGLESIGDKSFAECRNLESIVIPDSVERIGDRAFYNCHRLRKVDFSNKLKTIGNYAFAQCTSIYNITLPLSIEKVGYAAFACENLNTLSMNVNPKLKEYYERHPSMQENKNYYIAKNCLVERKSKAIIAGCRNSIIPSDGSITSIGSFAFYLCKGITEIPIPYGIVNIGESAFRGCDNLEKVELSTTIKNIDEFAFAYCTSLRKITIPAGVTKISCYIFYNCWKLSNLVLPSSVLQIENKAFFCCFDLQSISIQNTIQYIDETAFSGCSKLKIIFNGSKGRWKDISKKINVPVEYSGHSGGVDNSHTNPNNYKSDLTQKNDIKCDKGNTLYIYKTTTRCHSKKHKMVSATAVLVGRNFSDINLNVEYCTECGLFFMNFVTYERYKSLYGILLGDLRMYSQTAFNGDGMFLADQSPLKLYGYSVNSKDGLSDRERKYVISQAIDMRLMEKKQVVHYLEYFIKMNGKKKGNEVALSKWQDDLEFALTYNMDLQNRYYISDIKRYGKSRK